LKYYFKFILLKEPKESNRLGSNGTLCLYSLVYYEDKEPSTLKIAKSWSPSVFPLKRGVKVNSYAKIQPAAHTSIAVEYLVRHKMSYGAR
jgi:hypothetical protein